MTSQDRRNFLMMYLPGIVLTIVIYVMLLIGRDIRDNFEVEIWSDLGIRNSRMYAIIDSAIATVVLVAISLLILIRNNFRAFTVIHLLIISGCLLMGLGAWSFDHGLIGPITWMTVAGLGLYLAYIPYNAIFFERMIATFRIKGNVGFILYVADSAGYLGSVIVLVGKEFGTRESHGWMHFFKAGQYVLATVGAVVALFSYAYFYQKKNQDKKAAAKMQISLI